MKRIIGLLLLLAILSGVAYFALDWNSKKNNSTIDTYDRSFKVKDINSIHKIFIAQKNKPSVTLEKKGRDWYVNDKYKAHPNSVMRLLKVMTEIRMKYIPHPNALKNVIKEIGLIGVKVEIYDEADKNLKTYYIGGGTADELGTYMLMEGADQPYVMDVVSFEGSVRGRFLLTELQWRDKTFMAEKEENIKSVKVEYPKYKADSFVLDIAENEVQPMSVLSNKSKLPARQGTIKSYLKTMEKIGAESIKNNYVDKDSIKALIPFMNLTITHKDESEHLYRFFPLADLEQSNRNTKSVNEVKGIERYFVDCPNGDFILAQHLLVKGLMRPLGFFAE